MRNEAKINALKKAAAIDPLTKLLNKGAAKREIGELVKNVSGCLLMVDLDSFKPVNDLYGHAMGDKILIRFAGLLRSITRSNDCVGRVGGDEFIVFLREVNSKEVIGQKVIYLNEELTRSACEYMGDDMSVPIGVSVGGVFVPENGTDFAELSRLADQALYTVKENGKHGVFIFDRHQSAKAETKVQNLKVIRRVMDERGEAALRPFTVGPCGARNTGKRRPPGQLSDSFSRRRMKVRCGNMSTLKKPPTVSKGCC